MDIVKLAEQLKEAKDNTQYCLDNSTGRVDMKGLTYWAGRVEKLREQLGEVA